MLTLFWLTIPSLVLKASHEWALFSMGLPIRDEDDDDGGDDKIKKRGEGVERTW